MASISIKCASLAGQRNGMLWRLDPGRTLLSCSGRARGRFNLWALEEKSDWWRRPNRDPVQLTSGPVNYYQPVSSRSGKSIFAVGVQPSGELVSYDAAGKILPFLGGRSVDRWNLAVTVNGWLMWLIRKGHYGGRAGTVQSHSSLHSLLCRSGFRVGPQTASGLLFTPTYPGCLYKVSSFLRMGASHNLCRQNHSPRHVQTGCRVPVIHSSTVGLRGGESRALPL